MRAALARHQAPTAAPEPPLQAAAEVPKKPKKKKQKQQPPKLVPRFRLPNGALFELRYEAGSVLWTGSLTIPGSTPLVFRGSGPSVHKLLMLLAGFCRDEAGHLCTFEPDSELRVGQPPAWVGEDAMHWD
jgi:hypothetical protein